MTGPLAPVRAFGREVNARWLDPALAALILASTLVEALLVNARLAERLVALGPALIVATGVYLRRRAPLPALGLGLAGIWASNLLVYAVWNGLEAEYFGLLLLVYSMASRVDGRSLAAGIGLCVAGVVAITLTAPNRYFGDRLATEVLSGMGFFVVAPVFAGRLLRSRLRLNEALEEKAAEGSRDREHRAQEAVAAEHAHIASELHDLVAHALGAMTVQAAAARRLAATDAERAASAFAAVETTGRDALGELRTLLAVLRDDEGADPLHAPQPTLAALPALAARAQTFGLGVELDVSGPRPAELAAGVDLVAYRVVQDALRAAREDGGAGRAKVTLRYGADRLDIEVADDGFRVSDRRLLGLHERVRLYGGDVSTDAPRTGGHVLRARVPLDGVPA